MSQSSNKKRKRSDFGSLSGPIIDCFRRQEKAKNVNCPMCNCLVLHKNINEHLDNGCQKLEEDGESVAGGIDCDINSKCISEKIIIEIDDEDVDRTPSENRISPGECKIPDLITSDVDNALQPKNTCERYDGVAIIKDLLQDEESFLAEVFPSKDNMDSDISKDYSISSFEDVNLVEDSTKTIPYYLQNFILTVKTVMEQQDDKELFNDEDNDVVKIFHELSDKAKMLYVRLFQRKYTWFRMNKIEYPRISENLQPYFEELIKTGFLQTEAALTDLMAILNLLPASDIQDLAKYMHMVTNKTKSKKQLIDTLARVSRRQCSIFSTNGHRTQNAIKERAKLLLGSCVKLECETRNVFSRIILLFTLNIFQDDDNYASQLSTLFLINIGKIVYPSYEISRTTKIFLDRDDVIRYDLANQDLCHMDEAIENKDFDQAMVIYGKGHAQFIEEIENLANEDPRLICSVNLPVHLRRFTSTWLLTKMCSKGVDLLQRKKQYIKAVELLRLLLSQQEFCVTQRGWWWERLALNLDLYLKRPAEALQAVQEGLADTRVKTGRRLALEQRAKKICETKKNSSLRIHLNEIKFTELKQHKVVTISGKRLPHDPLFVLPETDNDGDRSYGAVEIMALRYYEQQGYNEGIHGEGITFNTLYGLLMWDVIFSDGVPDVFRTPFQPAPLDIFCENFYENRKKIIKQRLAEISNASVEQLTEWIKTTWLKQEGKTAVGIKWDLFTGVEQITELARCIGGKVMAGICERFATDYRHTRSGLPDLVVWNSKTLKYKIVEVKGPNDRLSTKQHVWLDVLVKLGVDAEVLYVKAVGGRKL